MQPGFELDAVSARHASPAIAYLDFACASVAGEPEHEAVFRRAVDDQQRRRKVAFERYDGVPVRSGDQLRIRAREHEGVDGLGVSRLDLTVQKDVAVFAPEAEPEAQHLDVF